MATCFLVLARFVLRLDHVLYRVKEIRFYHAFGEDFMTHVYSTHEVPYSEIKSVTLVSVLLTIEIKESSA